MKKKKNRKLKKSAKLILLLTAILIISLIIFLINNKKTQNENTQKNNNINNNTNNNNVKTKTNKFEDSKYYLEKNLTRYQEYENNNKDLSIDEIVKRVNCNLDKEFYVDVKPTDLSKNNLIIVNKFNYLEKDYVPKNLVELTGYGNGSLVKEAYDAYVEMYNAAKAQGLNLYVSTSYRNYNFQATLYNNYVNEDGQVNADTYSARPGYSEHQTGLAVDLGTTSNHSITQFGNSEEFVWVNNNCWKYGFIRRYTDESEYITGYVTEEWHYRYVGKDIAKFIYENNLTFEEYYAYYVEK